MIESKLNYFTHTVDGAEYGAWYRVISATHLEVLGVGMLEPGEYGGYSPDSSAKSILENVVRERVRTGFPMPSLATIEHQDRAEPMLNHDEGFDAVLPARL